MRQREHQSGLGTVKIVLMVFVIAVLSVTGLVLYQHRKPNSDKNSAATSQTQTATQPQSTVTQTAQANLYQGWNTYTSAEEKASFKYPTNWTVTKSVTPSNETNADHAKPYPCS